MVGLQLCTEEELGGSVAEAAAMSEKPESLDKSKGPLTGSWNYSSSSVKNEGTRLHGASMIWSLNRKVLDDATCDLVTLIQYFLVVLILMCGSTARSCRLRFVSQRSG